MEDTLKQLFEKKDLGMLQGEGSDQGLFINGVSIIS